MKNTALFLAMMVALSACSQDDTSDVAVADTSSVSAAAAPVETTATSAAPTDAQIAAIVVAANDEDVKAGEQAKGISTNPKVQEFAQRMITDHTAVNKQATDLVTKLNVTPEENPTSQGIRQSVEQTMSQLQGLSGAAFDKAYMDHEVAYHQQVIDAVDQTLIPSAQNAELKALLVQVRPALQAHLDMAKEIQGQLAS